MKEIDGKYHLWVQGEFYGVLNNMKELSEVFKDEIIPMFKEEQNERDSNQSTD